MSGNGTIGMIIVEWLGNFDASENNDIIKEMVKSKKGQPSWGYFL